MKLWIRTVSLLLALLLLSSCTVLFAACGKQPTEEPTPDGTADNEQGNETETRQRSGLEKYPKNSTGYNYTHSLNFAGGYARFYIDRNKNTLTGLMCLNEIGKYSDLYPKEDPMQRKQLGFDLIRSEIAKHNEQIERQNKARQKLQELCKQWGEEDGK